MRHLGLSRDSMSRLMNDRRRITAEEAEQIRDFFAADETAGPKFVTIPVFGYAAAGGEDRVAIANDRELERIEVPAGLTRGEAFGIRVAGDSMEPRLFSGEIVIVDRGVKPAKYGDCVVELNDDTALVKQYVSQRDGWLFLHQFNPDESVKVEASRIRALHAAYRWR